MGTIYGKFKGQDSSFDWTVKTINIINYAVLHGKK